MMNIQEPKLIGDSEEIKEVNDLIAKVADSQANVLVHGETGTGKELVARRIHYLSVRRKGMFVPVNCAAIPAELLESELFGHEKGAFTGALSSRPGRFEFADKGTLLLDEIGDMPAFMQVKLLRVLQEKHIERLGSNKPIKIDTRIIAATNCRLEENIIQGTFRKDLYYRLNVCPIYLPPLRERQQDILPLFYHFKNYFEQQEKSTVTLTDDALELIVKYRWPGNIRELGNFVERLCILHKEQIITPEALPDRFRVSSEAPPLKKRTEELQGIAQLHTQNFNLKDYLATIEINLISSALDEASGIVTRAAELLGIRRTTLVEKIKKYNLSKQLCQ